ANMIYEDIINGLESLADKHRAKAMEAYMKNKFTFYGIPSPDRTQLMKEIQASYRTKVLDRELVNRLWQDPYRECQYAAMDHMKRFKKYLTEDDFSWIIDLITKKSW